MSLCWAVRALLILLCLLSAPALSAAPAAAAPLISPLPSPDEEVARRHYILGTEAYDRRDYPTALGHFELVRKVSPSPEIEFNIARCLDRLERWGEAAIAYDQFAAGRPTDSAAREAASRAQVLRSRLPTADVRGTSPRRRARMRLAAGLTLGGALAFGIAGSAVYGSTYASYAERRDSCAGQCAPGAYDELRDRVQAGQIASGVLFGVAGVALFADVALWVIARREGPTRVALGAQGVELRF